MILVFLTGAAYEVLFLMWTHSASRGQPVRAALWSMAVGTLSLYGVSEVVREPGMAPALLLGYGVGTFATVRWLTK